MTASDERHVEDDPRWARLVARDRTADGCFWYSVLTTGVYCRPSCPSRRPNPRNVGLHATLQDAQATGFRACKRCKPEDASQVERHAALVTQACRLIETSDEPVGLAVLAETAGLSPGYFHRVFKAATGLSPKEYATGHRAGRLREQLVSGLSVTEAIHESGFNSSSRFYEQADRMLGMTPTAYRGGGVAEEIRFAVGQSTLGAILVASSRRGVAAILLGEEPEALLRNLQDRFPGAQLIGGDADYETLVARVVGFVESPARGFDLPLDIRGTVFQQRVWQALREVPVGETVSYAEIARRLGVPAAVRAVAGACAANAIALAIPCHRVVRTDGSLSGYRWGVDLKRRLIEREAAAE